MTVEGHRVLFLGLSEGSRRPLASKRLSSSCAWGKGLGNHIQHSVQHHYLWLVLALPITQHHIVYVTPSLGA